jgi:hypothetical protein
MKRSIDAQVQYFPQSSGRANHDLYRLNYQQKRRDSIAQTWRQARKDLYALPTEAKQQILAHWNTSSIPADAWYFADFITRKAERICPGIVKSRKDKAEELLIQCREIQLAKLKNRKKVGEQTSCLP